MAFGHRDYDAVSTREIVAKAQTNISAISYHFGSKQGLYLATAEYLAETLRARIEPQIMAVMEEVEDTDAARCLELLGELLKQLVNHLLAGGISEDAAGFIFREQHHPTEAFDILYQGLMVHIQTAVIRLVARIQGTNAEDVETILTSHALIGQVIAFCTGRPTLLRRLGKAQYSTEDLVHIGETIARLAVNALSPSPTDSGIEP
jgi:AcrR family transcriptional regulator